MTGTRDELTLDHADLFAGLAAAGAPPPVLGFGISTPDHVRSAVASGVAGVISGSAIVKLVPEPDATAKIETFVRTMKAATVR